jgi:hypothetical protein
MANYNSTHTGQQIDNAVDQVIANAPNWTGKQDTQVSITSPTENTVKFIAETLSISTMLQMIANKINALISNIGDTSGTISAGSGLSLSGQYCRRVGKMVHFGFSTSISTTISSNQTIATLPPNFRPVQRCGNVWGNSSSTKYGYIVGTDGAIINGGMSISSGIILYISGSFPAEN